MHDQKLDGPVRVGQCDFIFDKTLTWGKYIKEKPLAFCIGFHKKREKKVKEKIENTLGFEILTLRATRETHQAIIAVNDKFKEVVGMNT